MATPSTTAKKMRRDRKLSLEPKTNSKLKTVEDPVPKSSKISKGKKRKEVEEGMAVEQDSGAEETIKKAKKAKKAHVDVEETVENSRKSVLEEDEGKREESKGNKEKKGKVVADSSSSNKKSKKIKKVAVEEAVDIPQPKSKKSKNVVEVIEETLPESSTKTTKHSKNSMIPVKRPSPEPSDVAEDDSHLHGFSTDNDDSSDEEDGMDFAREGVDLGKLPTIAKDDATVKKKLEKAKRQKVSTPYL